MWFVGPVHVSMQTFNFALADGHSGFALSTGRHGKMSLREEMVVLAPVPLIRFHDFTLV